MPENKVIRQKNGSESPEKLAPKKMTGFWFYIVFTLICIDEFILDTGLNLTGFLAALTPIISQFITLITGFYLYTQKISITSEKLSMWIISVIIEFIPFINLFPTYALSILITKKIENNPMARKITSSIKNSNVIRSKRS